MNYRASVTTTVDLSTNRTIASGSTITVFGIMITNATDQAALIEFTDNSGAVDFFMVCPACDSKINNIHFVADGGLAITGLSSSSVTVTIYHSSIGS